MRRQGGEQQSVVIAPDFAALQAAVKIRHGIAFDGPGYRVIVDIAMSYLQRHIPGGGETIRAFALAEFLGRGPAQTDRFGSSCDHPNARQMIDKFALAIGRPAAIALRGKRNRGEGDLIVFTGDGRWPRGGYISHGLK